MALSARPKAADVIVCGGGPAGAATAWALARRGVDVLVVDRARFPRPKPCAEYLSPEASRILDGMGVLDAIEAAGAAHLGGMVIHAPNGLSFEGRFAATHGFRGFRDHGIALPRETLDAILLGAARAVGARVAEGVAVTDLWRDDAGRIGGVRVRDASGEYGLRAPLVVGADGLRSVVARRLGLAARTRWPSRLAFVAHVRGVSGPRDCGEMFVFRDGYCGLADVGGGVTNVALVVTAHLGAAARGDAEGFFARWIAAHHPLGERLRPAERLTPVRVTGPFAYRARRAWARGAVLVGDAADFYDPFTGEGIYAAMRGAELLAPHLEAAVRASSALDADGALAAYDHRRREEFAGKWRVERLVALAVAWPALLNRAARALRAERDLADLFVGVAGDFVPAGEVLNLRFAARVLAPRLRRAAS
jgi:2-polyprenyl-6-methoxyphenol hydroxylase-like FAD-dependent oxidoreductase